MTTEQDKKYMHQALVQAEKAYALGEVPVGAVIVREDKVIGLGWNCPISSNDPTGHAEIIALRDACNNESNYRLPNATMYVTIEPCTMCLGAIIHARITRVVYGASEPKAGVLRSHSHCLDSGVFNHSIQIKSGVLESECSELIQHFFQKRRKEKKAQKSLKN